MPRTARVRRPYNSTVRHFIIRATLSVLAIAILLLWALILPLHTATRLMVKGLARLSLKVGMAWPPRQSLPEGDKNG